MSASTDPIADLLTRIRNASQRGHHHVDVPASGVKLGIVKILAQEKFVRGYQAFDDDLQGLIRIFLRYSDGRDPVINRISRVSRPGRRVYAGYTQLPRVRNGLGIAILSTSSGVLSDRQARAQKVGGEVLCEVW